jgi:hypothetical protein
MSGNLVLVVDGKDHPVPPGSFFALTGKEPHAARCEGKEDCVMLVDARGPGTWCRRRSSVRGGGVCLHRLQALPILRACSTRSGTSLPV